MVQFHMRMSDHGDIQNLWSPSQELSYDVPYVSLSETFIISTCLKYEVWDGIISREMSDHGDIQNPWSSSQ